MASVDGTQMVGRRGQNEYNTTEYEWIIFMLVLRCANDVLCFDAPGVPNQRFEQCECHDTTRHDTEVRCHRSTTHKDRKVSGTALLVLLSLLSSHPIHTINSFHPMRTHSISGQFDFGMGLSISILGFVLWTCVRLLIQPLRAFLVLTYIYSAQCWWQSVTV